MKSIKKVLWEEGTFLTPQHFQQWDRHHDGLLRERVRGIQPFDWGLRSLDVDPSALEGGVFAVRTCSGVFRDGFYFDSELRDAAPPPRSFLELYDPAKPALGVYLALARVSDTGVVCADADDPDAAHTPFVKGDVLVADDVRANNQQSIQTAETNLRVLFDGEPLADFEVLKIAELVKKSSGGYAVRAGYAPPCVSLKVSPHLLEVLRNVVEVLGHRANALAGQRRGSGGLGEAMQYQLLSSLHRYYPRLAHYHNRQAVHPETVYLELASLAAEKVAFDQARSLHDVPPYNHENLGHVFKALEGLLLDATAGPATSEAILFTLAQRGPARIATVEPADMLQGAEFYLGVESDLPDERLVPELPRLAKVTSPTKIQEILLANLPGLTLRHVAAPPSAISIQAGRTYFQLQRSGVHWDAIEESHQIAISLPSVLQVRSLELYAVPRG